MFVQPLLQWKAKSIRYCVSVALLSGMQCTCAVLYYLLWPATLYHIFPHYIINGTILGTKVKEHEMCVSIFSAKFFSEIFLILKRTKRDMIKTVFWSSCKVPIFLVRF
jgi:hypothetical protein